MATNFPTSLDTLTNPTSSDSLSSPSHSSQHANVNDAVEALQAKVGADSSAVASSHDYLIADHASRLTALEGASGGKILQVVQATYGTAEATTSSTYVDTSLNASITPSATSSKVLVTISFNAETRTLSSNYARDVRHAIARGGTMVFEQLTAERYTSAHTGTQSLAFSATLVYLDSPATTSSVNYVLQHAGGAGTLTTFYNNRDASITLMEVAA